MVNMEIQTNGHDHGEEEDRVETLSPSSRFESLIDMVDIRVEAFIGDTSMTVRDLNALVKGDLVTLDANLNALVQLRVKQKLVALGELVAVGDQFGVRITELRE